MSHLTVEEYYLPYFSCTFEGSSEKYKLYKENLEASNSFIKDSKLLTFDLANSGGTSSTSRVSGLTERLYKTRKNLQGISTAEVEELLENHRIITISWKKDKISIILSDGTIVLINCRKFSSFPGQFSANLDIYFKTAERTITCMATSDKFVVFLFHDHQLLVARKIQHSDSGETQLKFNSYPDFLVKPSTSRKIENHISINHDSSLLLIWSPNKEDAVPWSPKPEQSSNILVYALLSNNEDLPEVDDLDPPRPPLISHLKSEHTLIDVQFIPESSDLIILESSGNSQEPLKNNNNFVREVIHEIHPVFRRISDTRIPLKGELSCFAYDCKMKRLAIGLCDSTIVVHSQAGKVTRFNKTAFIPYSIIWHSDSNLLVVLNNRGQLQIFDIALNSILLQEAKYRVEPSINYQLTLCEAINKLVWSPTEFSSTDSFLFLRFESGSMTILRISASRMKLLDLITFYLTGNQISDSIKVLQNVQWNSDANLCAFYLIFGKLITLEHSEEIEKNLEYLMESFYMPEIEMKENLRRKHGGKIRIVARRYFMWLLRSKKYHRALQVAISLDEDGLFHKLQGVASGNGDILTASEALRRLNLTRPSSSSSSTSGSDSQYSNSDGDSGSSTESCSSCPSEESIVEENLQELQQHHDKVSFYTQEETAKVGQKQKNSGAKLTSNSTTTSTTTTTTSSSKRISDSKNSKNMNEPTYSYTQNQQLSVVTSMVSDEKNEKNPKSVQNIPQPSTTVYHSQNLQNVQNRSNNNLDDDNSSTHSNNSSKIEVVDLGKV